MNSKRYVFSICFNRWTTKKWKIITRSHPLNNQNIGKQCINHTGFRQVYIWWEIQLKIDEKHETWAIHIAHLLPKYIQILIRYRKQKVITSNSFVYLFLFYFAYFCFRSYHNAPIFYAITGIAQTVRVWIKKWSIYFIIFRCFLSQELKKKDDLKKISARVMFDLITGSKKKEIFQNMVTENILI